MLTNVALRQGNTGILDTASKGSLEDEFGTSNEDEVVKQILEKGHIIETGVRPPEKMCMLPPELTYICRALPVMVSRMSHKARWSATELVLVGDIEEVYHDTTVRA